MNRRTKRPLLKTLIVVFHSSKDLHANAKHVCYHYITWKCGEGYFFHVCVCDLFKQCFSTSDVRLCLLLTKRPQGALNLHRFMHNLFGTILTQFEYLWILFWFSSILDELLLNFLHNSYLLFVLFVLFCSLLGFCHWIWSQFLVGSCVLLGHNWLSDCFQIFFFTDFWSFLVVFGRFRSLFFVLLVSYVFLFSLISPVFCWSVFEFLSINLNTICIPLYHHLKKDN